MAWWCNGTAATPWTWTPQPYVGVWLVMLALAAGYVAAMRWYADQPGGQRPTRSQQVAFVTGWLLLWAATDWPLGTLSAGYLLTASMIQIVVYYYIAAPLLVAAVPPGLRLRLLESHWGSPLAYLVRRPLIAFAMINIALILTHLPGIADELKSSQVGTMVMDLVWLTTGILFWWALEAYREVDSSSGFIKRSLFVAGSKLVPTAIGIILTFSVFPLYTTYEFANRVWPSISAGLDQQIAGLLMWEGMAPFILLRLGLVFRAAYLSDERSSAGHILGEAASTGQARQRTDTP